MGNLKIWVRMAIGFSLAVALTAAMGFFSLRQLDSINQNAADIATDLLPGVRLTQDIGRRVADFRVQEYKHVLTNNDEDLVGIERQMDEIAQRLAADSKAYEALPTSQDEKQIYEALQRTYQDYLARHAEILTISRAHQDEKALALLVGDSERLYDKLNEQATALVDLNVKAADVARTEGDEIYHHSHVNLLIMMAACLLIA